MMRRCYWFQFCIWLLCLTTLFMPSLSAQQEKQFAEDRLRDKIQNYKQRIVSTNKGSDVENIGYVLSEMMSESNDVLYGAIKAAWGEIDNTNVKNALLNVCEGYTRSTRFENGILIRNTGGLTQEGFEVICLALEDATPVINERARRALTQITLQPIERRQDLDAWRKKYANLPFEEQLYRSTQDVAQRIATGTPKDRRVSLPILANLTLITSMSFADVRMRRTQPYEIPDDVRVRALVKSKMANSLILCMRPEVDKDIRVTALRAMARIVWDKADIMSVETTLQKCLGEFLKDAVRNKQPNFNGISLNECLSLLGKVERPWATDMMFDLLKSPEDYERTSLYILLNAIGNSNDPRTVPAIIGYFERIEENPSINSFLNLMLRRIVNAPITYSQENRDGAWWRNWWEDNKQNFSEETRKAALVYLKKKSPIQFLPNFWLRRRFERIVINEDQSYIYWLVSAGYLGSKQSEEKPGVIVVLNDTDPQNGTYRSQWQEAIAQAVEGRYLIVLIKSPDTKSNLWKLNPSQGDPKIPTVQELVAKVVADVQKRTDVNSQRILLHGEGVSGLAVYACSLEKKTPFMGFSLFTSPFRTAQLPPLATSKQRRYFISHRKGDKQAPFFLAQSAETLLKKNGAVVSFHHASDLSSFGSGKSDELRQMFLWMEKNVAQREVVPQKPITQLPQ